MKMNNTIKKALVSLLASAVFCAVFFSGWLFSIDAAVSDKLYQRAVATDGEIIVIGMDQRAVDMLGPMPWPRSVMAEAIEYLNYSEPDARPAVIGIDVLFIGESGDPDADAYLAEVVADSGNVVLAAAATFGSELVRNDSEFYIDTSAVLAWDAPFDALAEGAAIAHINAMTDKDGVIRHALFSIDVPGVGTVESFPWKIYARWCEENGVSPNPAPETKNGFFYLPYTGVGGAYYESISIADLLEGTVEAGYFDGKIVMIGPYASGMQDEYRTALDHAVPMYGIEIQANVVDAFRRGFYPSEAGEVPQAIALFVICALCLWFFLDRRVRDAIILWLGVSILWIVLCLLAYRGGLILHVLYVPLSVTILFIVTVAVNYIRAQREKHRITDTFGHYVDPAVMDELLRQGSDALELGGKTYDIAVLFVDIRGFTTMSESLDPPTVVEIINRYLTLTTECIMRHHGTLDKFVGDCTMAIWNAPVPQEDPIYLACCAAMDMVEGSKALGQELLEQYGRTVSFGVGVHYGPAVVGNIGAPKRMDYTAIGDTVNTASRLESNAPGGTIFISRVVADALGERAKTTSLGGTIKLKGKAEGFEVLTLDSLS